MTNKPTRKHPDEYDVGYLKPPKDRRFQKGQSGNPKGRPKKPPMTVDAILDEPVTVKENGELKTYKTSEIMIKAQVRRAMTGDIRAFKLLHEMAPNYMRKFDREAAANQEALAQKLMEGLDLSAHNKKSMMAEIERLRALLEVHIGYDPDILFPLEGADVFHWIARPNPYILREELQKRGQI